MLFRSIIAVAGLLFLAGTAQSAPLYPNPPTVSHWILSEEGHDPRLRVVNGRPVDVIFPRDSATDWRWDIEERLFEQVAPTGKGGKVGVSSERFSACLIDPREVAVYEYETGAWWSVQRPESIGTPAIYDGTIAWSGSESIMLLDADSREIMSIQVSGGSPSMVGIWGNQLAYSLSETNERWNPNKLYVRNLLTGSTRLAFDGSRVGYLHVSQGRVAYLGRSGSTVGLYVERLAVSGSAIQVRTPEHCDDISSVRVAGATGNLVVYEASCGAPKREVYVSVVDSGAIYFVSRVGTNGHQFDAQSRSIAYFSDDGRLHVITLDESRM